MHLTFPHKVRFSLLILLSSSVAFAHPGHEVSGFLSGFFHPLEGIDHLMAAFSIGLLAARSQGQFRLGLPLLFATGVFLGGVLGVFGHAVPFYENGIQLSLLLLGFAFLLPLAPRPPLRNLGLFTVVLFGIFHGNAHSYEVGKNLSALPYCLAFILSTALLHFLGILTMESLKKLLGPPELQIFSKVTAAVLWATFIVSL